MGANRDNARRGLRHEPGERCGEMARTGYIYVFCHYSAPKGFWFNLALKRPFAYCHMGSSVARGF